MRNQNFRYPNGFMMSGDHVTIWRWPWNSGIVGLTRTCTVISFYPPQKKLYGQSCFGFNQFISVFFLFQATVASMFVAILGRINSSSSGSVLSRKRNPQRTRSKLVGIPKKTWQRSCIGMRIFFRQTTKKHHLYIGGCL